MKDLDSIWVGKVCTREISLISKDCSLDDVFQMMDDFEVPLVVITENNRPIGYIQEHDLNMIPLDIDLEHLSAVDIMTTDPYCVVKYEPLEDVAFSMLQNESKIAIVTDEYGSTYGVFTSQDALFTLFQLLTGSLGTGDSMINETA